MNTIKDAWDSFERKVIPNEASSVQRLEMKKAFYAGVHSTLQFQLGLVDTKLSEDAMVLMLQGWHEEVEMFVNSLLPEAGDKK
jgi:hypothetical protein